MSANVYIIAGPNGAGKTTFAREFLPNYAHCPNFVNADLIAARLSPKAPERVAIAAGRLMLEEIETFAEQRADFGFETTLAGRGHLNLIRDLKRKGYVITYGCRALIWRFRGYENAFLGAVTTSLRL